MRTHRLIIAAVVVLFVLALPIHGQDFGKGLDAYDRGDFATALREWKPLAEAGMARAQYGMGVIYDNGEGVKQDHAAAARWYRLAAEQGYASAQTKLALKFRNGDGETRDYAEAVKWYRLAAEQGEAEAQNSLGFLYGNGRGVAQDYVYAHMWFNLAAAQSHELAEKNREIIAGKMTAADISEAHRLAREWLEARAPE